VIHHEDLEGHELDHPVPLVPACGRHRVALSATSGVTHTDAVIFVTFVASVV
jgi:hypothetical protein